MKNLYIFVFIFLFTTNSTATIKENIIQNLKNIYNISFNFEQNINGKIENGKCVILYPKKINCIYDSTNKKILVSNGKSLVIKTKNSYYRYSLKKTSLNLILNKEFLLKKIRATNGREIDNKFINYKFQEEEMNKFQEEEMHPGEERRRFDQETNLIKNCKYKSESGS